MKLLRLKITDPAGFRSLQAGFEVYFLRDWHYTDAGEFNPYILAGPNGSGKSNVLEALAAIFYHIECIYLDDKPASFDFDKKDNPQGFRSEVASPNGFELEYFTPAPLLFNKTGVSNYAHIQIAKEQNKSPLVYCLNREVFEIQDDPLHGNNEKPLTRLEIKEILPEFVLGYSSGENEILSLPFFKMRFIHFDEYQDYLKRQLPYSSPEGRLTFISREYDQAVILSNLLLQDKALLQPYRDEVGVEDIKSFRIIVKKYIHLAKNQVTKEPEHTERFQEKITETFEDEMGEMKYRLDLTQNLGNALEKFKQCATCSFYDVEKDEWYLDFWVNEATKQAFAHAFDSAIELFQAFQILLTLNLYAVSDNLKKRIYHSASLYVNETVPTLPADERIMRFEDFRIKKNGIKQNVLLKALSDGEHQFLHSLGLCLLFKDKRCLFLLDEPETHFNPSWRAKFISSVRDCFQTGIAQSTLREMLITTHTPFLISDSRKEYVLLFNKNLAKKRVEVTRPDYNTLGASINKITMTSFGKTETIGGYAEKQLNAIKKRFEAGEPKQEIIDDVNHLLGDSVEKILFVKKVLDSMEGK